MLFYYFRTKLLEHENEHVNNQYMMMTQMLDFANL